MKSLYYCRSLSIQRADNVSEKAVGPVDLVPVTTKPAVMAEPTNYEECLACQ